VAETIPKLKSRGSGAKQAGAEQAKSGPTSTKKKNKK